MKEDFQLKYIRKLIIALTASGLLNILLLSSFFYWLVKDTPPSPYFEQKPAMRQEQQTPLAIEGGNAELIHYFRSLTFDQLVSKLPSQQLIENGYTERDIALACLVAFHHFDLAKALVGHALPDQQRSIAYGRLKSGKVATLIVYPGLTEQQFLAIIDFAKTERWPLTSKGLYWQQKKLGNLSDSSLVDTFSMSQEFLAVELLFNRADVHTSKEELLKMLLEGNWAMLSSFAEQQKLVQDLSSARRQHFLLNYIDIHSKTAANLLIKLEGDFALKKLDDQHVIQLLNLLSEKTEESEKFALALLTSPRSDSVWKMAGEKLYQYAGETIPEKNVHHTAMNRFVPGHSIIEIPQETPPTPKYSLKTPPKTTSVKKSTTPGKAITQPKKDRLYIVQEGDTLWKISKRFHVDMDQIRQHNKLKSDSLKPGSPLRIPL